MNTLRIHRLVGLVSCVLALGGTSLGWAQTFSSGSTGADGGFAPTCAPTPCTVTAALPPSGVLHYTTATIPAGVTVIYTNNAANTPVTMLATSDVTIAGTIRLDGATGGFGVNSAGAGGPGGFPGGNGALATGGGGSAGQGPGGGEPGSAFSPPATYGAPSNFVSLMPLVGGSGGGGSLFVSSFFPSGASGAGGGGAIVVASSTKITVTGAIHANGGPGNDSATFGGCGFAGTRGAGGAIRLVAPQITGSGGTLSAAGGPTGFPCFVSPGGDGRIRLEAFTTTGLSVTSTPAFSFSPAPGPVTAASTPALINLPTLTITSVGGVAAPGIPTGSYGTADVSLAPGTTNPVSFTLTAAHIPVGTVFTVRLLPQSGTFTTVPSTPSSGTFATSSATASVNFPIGQVSVLNAFASFTLPQLASLLPWIEGEPVERVLVAAEYGGPSTLTLVTRSGKELRADQLPPETQLKLARAFAALNDQATR